MGLGMRDATFWVREARRKALVREAMLINAVLLPHQKPEVVRQHQDRILAGLAELDSTLSGSEIDALEKENRELMERSQKRAAEVLARRKSRGANKKRRPAAKARRIR